MAFLVLVLVAIPYFLALWYRKRAVDIRIFSNYMARLVRKGAPIDEGLDALHGELGGKISDVIAGMSQMAASQPRISDRIAHFERFFTPSYANTVLIGEGAGRLAEAFQSAGAFQYRVKSYRSRMLFSMVYPIVIALVCVSAMDFFGRAILPKLSQIAGEFAGTAGAFAAPDVFDWLKLYAFVLIGVIVLVWLVERSVHRYGGMFHLAAHLSEVLGAGGSFGDILAVRMKGRLLRRVARADSLIAGGTPVVEAFRAAGRWPKDFLFFLGEGAVSGDYATSFRRLSEIYEARFRRDIERSAKIIGLVLIVLVSVVVFFVGWYVLGWLGRLMMALGTFQ